MQGKHQKRISRLCHAALVGDVSYLQRILPEDPNILRRCMIQNSGSFMHSPLHIASKNGHLQFINVILQHQADLAKEIFQPYGCVSPLHLASEMGHLEIVRALLVANPNMCFTQDEHGRNPIHIAAMMGKVEVFKELVRMNPQAARKRANGGETYLHLCIEYGQTQALTELLSLTLDLALVNATDSKGDTILHYAVYSKKFEMVKIVAEDERIEKGVENKERLTALCTQVLLTGEKLDAGFQLFMPDKFIRWNDEDTIGRYLENAYNKSTKEVTYSQRLLKQDNWFERNRNSMPVVASLIAAMSFQAGINPPGGTWHDSDFDHNLNMSHVPGVSILSSTFPNETTPNIKFTTMMTFNALAFLSSLIVIFFSLIMNITFFRRRPRWVYFNVFMSYNFLGLAVVCTMLTYFYSTSFLIPESNKYHSITTPGSPIVFIVIVSTLTTTFCFAAGPLKNIQRHKKRSQFTRSSQTLHTVPSILP